MRRCYFLLLWILVVSCQSAEERKSQKIADTMGYDAEQVKELEILQHKQRQFCECLVNDSLSNAQKLREIDRWLAQGVDINTPCSYPETVSYKSLGDLAQNVAASVGNLLSRGRPFRKTSSSRTEWNDYPPVMIFVQDTAMLRQFAQRNAQLNKSTADVLSVIEFWAQQENKKMIDFVLNLGTPIANMRILTANEEIIDYLLQRGANPQRIDKLILFKQKNFEKLVLKYKIDIETCTCKEVKSIIRATTFHDISYQRMAFLLEHKAQAACIDEETLIDIVDMKFDNKEVPFSTKAHQAHRKKFFDLLATQPIDWNVCGRLGRTPLLVAVRDKDFETVKYLLQQGAKADFPCEFAARTKTAISETEQAIEKLNHDPENKTDIQKLQHILELLKS